MVADSQPGRKQRSSTEINSGNYDDTQSSSTNVRNQILSAHEELRVATSPSTHKFLLSFVVGISVIVVAIYFSNNLNHERKFALARENLPLRMQKFECAPNTFETDAEISECVPKKCGRFVSDTIVEPEEAELLLDLARRVISKAGSSGGASILDIHTGALSYREEFISVFNVPQIMEQIREEHLIIYNFVKGKIQRAIAEQFGIPSSSLYLTYPTFFSRLTNTTARTMHDEYWHEHIDKETYPCFHYTSLLYLTTYNKDFKGGRFVFVDGGTKNRTTSAIEPKKTRVIAFTSGAENRHHVEQVTDGERYAVTISFTCNHQLGIEDPKLKKN